MPSFHVPDGTGGLRPGNNKDALGLWQEGVEKRNIGVAFVPGRPDRLVIDTSINGITASVVQEQKIQNVSFADVDARVNNDSSKGRCVTFSADVNRVHKIQRPRQSEHGHSTCDGNLLCYAVCRFLTGGPAQLQYSTECFTTSYSILIKD